MNRETNVAVEDMAAGEGVAAGQGVLNKGADIVGSTRETLERQLPVVEGHVRTVASGWSGQSASAFNLLMLRWADDSSTVIGALSGLEENLRGSEQAYQAADAQESDNLVHIMNRLNSTTN